MDRYESGTFPTTTKIDLDSFKLVNGALCQADDSARGRVHHSLYATLGALLCGTELLLSTLGDSLQTTLSVPRQCFGVVLRAVGEFLKMSLCSLSQNLQLTLSALCRTMELTRSFLLPSFLSSCDPWFQMQIKDVLNDNTNRSIGRHERGDADYAPF